VPHAVKPICGYSWPFVFQSLGSGVEETGAGRRATQAGRAVPHTGEVICEDLCPFVFESLAVSHLVGMKNGTAEGC
jgi:hypothetical protein